MRQIEIYGRERAWLRRRVGNVTPVLLGLWDASCRFWPMNGWDMVRQGYHRPHVTATAVRRPWFLNAPISLHSAQGQHHADGHVTSQLAPDTRGKGPLASGTASVINRFTPNAPLTSKRCILYIYSTNIDTEYFKHALYSPFFFSSSKCSLFHNANLFGVCIVHILHTECAKIKKIIPAPKG